VIRRYLLRLATVEFRLAGRPLDGRVEQWIGIEVASDEPIDLETISARTGKHMIPCEGMTAEEIASCGVTKFERIGL
jgi:hypothetical protein